MSVGWWLPAASDFCLLVQMTAGRRQRPPSSGYPSQSAETPLANFHLLRGRRRGGKRISTSTIGSCPNLEPDFRSLGLIRPNLQPIYHLCEETTGKLGEKWTDFEVKHRKSARMLSSTAIGFLRNRSTGDLSLQIGVNSGGHCAAFVRGNNPKRSTDRPGWVHTFCSSFLSMSEKLLSVPPRIYKRHVCNSSSGGDLHLERWSIPMISPKFPPLTLKIVEHSRYLPTWPIRPADEIYNAKVGGASSPEKAKEVSPKKTLLPSSQFHLSFFTGSTQVTILHFHYGE